MDNLDNQKDKQTWFGPKRMGFGFGPRTWQGWVITLAWILIEISFVAETHSKYPSWFIKKTSGTGFNPATWQGWLVVFMPAVVFLAIMTSITWWQRRK